MSNGSEDGAGLTPAVAATIWKPMAPSPRFDPARLPAMTALGAIRVYQLTLSSLAGRQCRHLPTCSAFAAEAIDRHGLWAGGWMTLGRVCRCRPGGTDGFDPVPPQLPEKASVTRPWRYARWRGPL